MATHLVDDSGTQGAYLAALGRLRDELRNVHEFVMLHDAREKLKARQEVYNYPCPHGSPGHVTPDELVKKRSAQANEAARV
jgi:putative transposase